MIDKNRAQYRIIKSSKGFGLFEYKGPDGYTGPVHGLYFQSDQELYEYIHEEVHAMVHAIQLPELVTQSEFNRMFDFDEELDKYVLWEQVVADRQEP